MSDGHEGSNGILPEGWGTFPLGQLVSPSKEKIEPSRCPDAPYLSLEHIESGTNRIESKGVASDVKSTKAVFHRGDVLYGKLRPYLNKVTIPDFDGVCSTDILVFRPSTGVLPEYLLRFLSESSFVQYATDHQKGNSLPRVAFGDLAKYPLPLPPFAEQKRIVAKVEALLARVNNARERLDRVPDILKKFRQSVLAAACSGRLTADWREENPNVESGESLLCLMRKKHKAAWESAELAKLAAKGGAPRSDGWKKRYKAESDIELTGLPEVPESWAYGRTDELVEPDTVITYGIVLPGPQVDEGIPYIRGQDIDDRGRILVEQLARTAPEIAAKHSRSQIAEGDVLLCVIRNLRVAVVPPGLDGVNLTQGTVRLRPSDVVSATYLAAYLAGPYAQEWMKQRYVGLDMPRINVRDSRAIPVPLPPREEQEEIVRRMTRLLGVIDSVEDRVREATASAENISHSVLAKAFAGELVETEADLARREGREYEPASVLLERIFGQPARAASAVQVEKGRAILDILLLLEAWGKPVSISALEPALVLMRNEAARQTLLKGVATPGQRRSMANEPEFVDGLDTIYQGLIANGAVRKAGRSGLKLANSQLLAKASKADRARAAETLQAIRALSTLRSLPKVVAAITNERYEITV
ncbi:MAG: restriction endonuclease subunit S [Pirellulales bacterium]|nr:restriction endonuclease subunit S [Pirellulales bacterium]